MIQKTVIFGAGGTAGHLFIARGIAYHTKGKRVLITDIRGLKYACDCKNCQCKGGKEKCIESVFDEIHVLPIKSSGVNLDSIRAICTSYKILKQYKNSVFIGCGAYPSLISGIAAVFRGIDVHIYQGDQVVGLANRILQYFAKVSWVSSDNLHLKNRQIIGCIPRHYMRHAPIENDGKFRILIIGSSIGSSLLSDRMPSALSQLDPVLLQKIEIYHQIRQNEKKYMEQMYTTIGVQYFISEFIDTRLHLPRAHLVICRAGWSVISDVIAVGRAAIFIPWKGASKNHQYYNAIWASRDNSYVLDEDECNPSQIAEIIANLAQDMFQENKDTVCIDHGKIYQRATTLNRIQHEGGYIIAKHIGL
jgi:UDP-N-acetylglucosamine--N-acetylmuramyl-(pentapeptide) pyrophosphoryl-undecaprenol N-acetylglucosamine transferase